MSVCVSVCQSATTCLHYCTDPESPSPIFGPCALWQTAGWIKMALGIVFYFNMEPRLKFKWNNFSRPTVLIGLSWFLVILQNAPILKFSRVIVCNFHLEPKLWRHKWSHFRFCKSCRVMRFPSLDSSEDFMRWGGLRFSLSYSFGVMTLSMTS